MLQKSMPVSLEDAGIVNSYSQQEGDSGDK
jgi:hypothetical protein